MFVENRPPTVSVSVCKLDECNLHTYIFHYESDHQHHHGGGGEEVDGIMVAKEVWQVLLSVCATTFALSFGMMLGWPSPAFPKLINQQTITFNQSPLMAAFLMYGNIFAIPFNTWKFNTTKHGIQAALIIKLIGWLLLWQSTDVTQIFISRFLVGIGNGYGIGQLKSYVKEICDAKLAGLLLKSINCWIFTGVLLIYIIGGYATAFEQLALYPLFIIVGIFILVFLLPNTPISYYETGELKSAELWLERIKGDGNLNNLLAKKTNTNLSLVELIKIKKLWPRLTLMICIVFVQQFSGAPATIVYGEFMMSSLDVANPRFMAIFYALTFLIGNILGNYLIATIPNKKLTLFLGCFFVGIILSVQIVNLRMNLATQWSYYLSFVVMLLYIFTHGCFLTSIPFTLGDYLFPQNARNAVAQFHLMFFSLYAIVITKLFQVFYSNFDFFVIYALFLAVCIFGMVVVLIFVPNTQTN